MSSPEGIYLETPRLNLRRLTAADASALNAIDQDPEVMRFINGGTPVPMDTTRTKSLPAMLAWYERSPHFGFWAAIERAGGDFLGWFHFRPPHEPDVAGIELGYRLKRAAWGRGYATEGSVALIRKGFEELGVERVVAKTLSANAASRRVMEKAGLRFVETFTETRIDPPQEAVWYALDRADYGRCGIGGAIPR